MKFKKYQHVCRLETEEVEGILQGKCYVFPKLDGTNASVWLNEEGILCAGSRNRELGIGNDDNYAFYHHIKNDEKILSYLKKHPTHRLFGEWLVPHTLKTYTLDSWKKFYIFDVSIDDGDELKYLPYDEYAPLLKEFDLLYLDPLAIIDNPNVEEVKELVKSNTYRIRENAGYGEGIVIKRYNFVNKYGRIVWAKVLHDEFSFVKQNKTKKIHNENQEVEELILEDYVTSNFIEKEYSKIINEHSEINRKSIIPMLLSKVWYELINEEMWNILKKYKNPTIDFKKLNKKVINKIKEVKADLFCEGEKDK